MSNDNFSSYYYTVVRKSLLQGHGELSPALNLSMECHMHVNFDLQLVRLTVLLEDGSDTEGTATKDSLVTS